MHEFVSESDLIVLNRYRQPDPIFKLKLDDNGNVVKNFFDYDGKRVSCIDEIMVVRFIIRFLGGFRGSHLPSRFWMGALFSFPLRWPARAPSPKSHWQGTEMCQPL